MVKIPDEAVQAAKDVLYYANPNDVERALTAALPHLLGVGVKKLERSEHPAGGVQALAAGLGLYRVHANGDDWYLVPDHMGKGGKAAAQADYSARILSALEPSAARERALEEAARVAGNFLMLKTGLHVDKIVELEAAIRALSSPDHADAGKVEGDGWLPIESAPKDKAILVHYDDGNIELISADDNMFSWIAYTVKEDFCTKPTHWHQLPSAPASEGAE